MVKNIFFLVFIYMLAIGCSKERNPIFDARMNARFDIPSGLNTIETHFFTIRNVPTFFLQSASNAGIIADSVKNVQSARGLLRPTFNTQDYDFIERISIYAVSINDPTLKREMYYLDFVPFNTNDELRMLSSTSELIEIFKNDFIDLEIRLNFRAFSTRTIPTTIDFGYVAF